MAISWKFSDFRKWPVAQKLRGKIFFWEGLGLWGTSQCMHSKEFFCFPAQIAHLPIGKEILRKMIFKNIIHHLLFFGKNLLSGQLWSGTCIVSKRGKNNFRKCLVPKSSTRMMEHIIAPEILVICKSHLVDFWCFKNGSPTVKKNRTREKSERIGRINAREDDFYKSQRQQNV